MSGGRARAPAVVVAVVLLLAGCAGSPGGRGTATTGPAETTPAPATPGPIRLWIAVYEAAPDPNDLERSAEELMERAGTAVVVAPEGCFRTVRGAEVEPGDYVLALVAPSRSSLDEAVDRAGREPALTARVEDLCPV